MDFFKTEDLFSQLECFLDSMVNTKKVDERRSIAQDMQRIHHTLYLRMTSGPKQFQSISEALNSGDGVYRP